MKTRRGKRSEQFWSSIVMKKWLNIKPKLNDFSEDEVDTETESEDDACSIKEARVHAVEDHTHRIQGNQSACVTQTSGAPSKGYTSRHRRGKSETLRLQYINTKDVRVTIGTWNVAGRLPYDDLEIDDWLCMKEPADIYILGFQEVVPLNAGNVLGAETRMPIPKWEAIIRRTLNGSLEPETEHKSYTAPSSPVLRTCSSADILVDEIDDTAFAILGEGTIGTTNASDSDTCKLNGIVGMGKKLQLKRIYGMAPSLACSHTLPLLSLPSPSPPSLLRRTFAGKPQPLSLSNHPQFHTLSPLPCNSLAPADSPEYFLENDDV